MEGEPLLATGRPERSDPDAGSSGRLSALEHEFAGLLADEHADVTLSPEPSKKGRRLEQA